MEKHCGTCKLVAKCKKAHTGEAIKFCWVNSRRILGVIYEADEEPTLVEHFNGEVNLELYSQKSKSTLSISLKGLLRWIAFNKPELLR